MHESKGRGGKREGSGRPEGSLKASEDKTTRTEVFYKRCTPEQKKKLESYYKEIIKEV